MQRTPKSTLAGIFFLGLSVIVFEIALTRVFAIMMWHHFTYMVISIGLLGFGASGSLLTATRLGADPATSQRALVWTSLGYGVSVLAAFCFATLVRIDSLAIWQQKENFVALLFVYLIVFVPFLLGGLGIGIVLTRHVQHVNRLYGGDLVGSALGAAVAVVLLKQFGSSATCVFAGVFGLLAAVCFACGHGAPRRLLPVAIALLLGGTWLGIAFGGGSAVLGIGDVEWRVPYAPGKEGNVAEWRVAQDPSLGRIVKIPSATARVEVGPSVVSNGMVGGDFGRVDRRDVEGRPVGQDGTAPTMLFRNATELERFPFLDDTQAASAYVVRRAAGLPAPEVMVIGVGGGVDVMVALANGASRVTAVELNTAMIEMVTERFGDYLGGLFRPGAHPAADRIELVNSEGRAWLRSQPRTFDLVQMSGVDSYTALSTGAYTLSESYLYTVEAVQDFWSRLNPHGIVCWSRFIELPPRKSRETLRLAHIAATALRRLGVAAPAAHVCVFQGAQWASTMVKKSPFTAVEIAALRDFAWRQGFVGLIHDPTAADGAPFLPEPSHFNPLRQRLHDTLAAVPDIRVAPAAIEPTLDAVLERMPAIAAGQPLTAAMLPEVLRGEAIAPHVLDAIERLRPAIVAHGAYMQATGADFSRLLRGSDAERARFVADYPYDVSPSTDDRPFFFNYYRWSSVFGGGAGKVADGPLFTYTTDFPIGHWVLFGSMVQILALAAVLIFLPLRRLARTGLRAPGALRCFAYFAALGLGFMLIEIALMQKLVIFLGHPTYALSVVLAGLLAAAGVGSMLAGRIAVVTPRHLRWLLAGIAAVVIVDVLAVNHLLPLLLGASLPVRIAVVLALLVPTGLVLGMPFPSGMRLIEATSPQLVPWGWAINAFFSVFGSIFCIVLSMAVGFSNVFYGALAIYAVGLLGMRASTAPAAA